MAEISTVNGLSVNAVQNADLKRKYDKHINKILQISEKKSSVKLISEEQKKISEILKRSKEMSKNFKNREFTIKCQAENQRLLKSLSTINTRQRVKTEREDSDKVLPRRMKTLGKEKVMREFQIEMENRKLAQNIMDNMCDVQDYKKRMKKEISEYMKLKGHLQRLKPAHLEKLPHYQDVHSSIKLNLKTVYEGQNTKKSKSKTIAVREKPQS